MVDYKGNEVLTDEELPKLSILTPCYERSEFVNLMLCNLANFDYPKNKLEFCVLQDGPEDLFEKYGGEEVIRKALYPIQLVYKYEKGLRRTIGEKRNILVKKMATSKYVAFMDSDDVYFPSYPRYAMSVLKKNKMGVVGSQSMLFTFPYHNYEMSAISCSHKRQIHEATMVMSVRHFRQMSGFQKSSQGEGVGILDYAENRAHDLDITLVMCCVDHGENTIPKEQFRKNKIDGKMSGIHLEVLKSIMNYKKSTKTNLSQEEKEPQSQ